MLSGDNGILQRAGNAKDETIAGQEKEQVELAYVSAAVKKLGNNVDKDDLQDELDISVGNNKTKVEINADDTLNVLFHDTEHNYKVNTGTVTRVADGTGVDNTDLDKLHRYFIGKTYDDVWDEVNNTFKNNDILTDADTLTYLDWGAATNYNYTAFEYNGDKYTLTENYDFNTETSSFIDVSEFTIKDVSNLKLYYKANEYVSDTKLRFDSGATAFSLKNLSNIFELEQFEFTSSDESILWLSHWDEDNDWALCRQSPVEPSREVSVTFTGKQSCKSISLQIEL